MKVLLEVELVATFSDVVNGETINHGAVIYNGRRFWVNLEDIAIGPNGSEAAERGVRAV